VELQNIINDWLEVGENGFTGFSQDLLLPPV
jgi:hypothetical protein